MIYTRANTVEDENIRNTISVAVTDLYPPIIYERLCRLTPTYKNVRVAGAMPTQVPTKKS